MYPHWENITAYNVTIDDDHTYYAGTTPILVQDSIWCSPDPAVGEVANDIETAYPGHVVGVNVPAYNSAGQLATDFDVETQNAVIQLRTGSATGLGAQMAKKAAVTSKVVIGYAPDAPAAALAEWGRQGYLVTNDLCSGAHELQSLF